jgi:hypothetical protein
LRRGLFTAAGAERFRSEKPLPPSASGAVNEPVFVYRLKNSGRRVPNRTGLEQKNVGQKNQALQVERYFSARHFSAAPNF